MSLSNNCDRAFGLDDRSSRDAVGDPAAAILANAVYSECKPFAALGTSSSHSRSEGSLPALRLSEGNQNLKQSASDAESIAGDSLVMAGPLPSRFAARPVDRVGKPQNNKEYADMLLDKPRAKWAELTDETLKDAPRAVVDAVREIGRQLLSQDPLDLPAMLGKLDKVNVKSADLEQVQKALFNLSDKMRKELGVKSEIFLDDTTGKVSSVQLEEAAPGTTNKAAITIILNPTSVVGSQSQEFLAAPPKHSSLDLDIAQKRIQATTIWYPANRKR